MILILTLNPLLERRFYYNQISLEQVNRNAKVIYQAGGKGLNVSRQLKKLGIVSHNIIFSGGQNGKKLRELIRNEELLFTSIHIEEETRHAAIIISEADKKLFSFFSSNPFISEKEVEEMKSTLKKTLPNCEMIVISGSAPNEAAERIVEFAISEANRLDKISFCDYYGNNLENVFNLSPTIIHNNFEEIENHLNVNLRDEETALVFLKSIYDKGIKRVYLTDGANSFYAQNFDYVYKVFPPAIDAVDSTGSGDAFVSGLIYTLKENEVFEQSLKYSTALAAENSKSFEVCSVEKNSFENLFDNVSVEPIGKKIKLIDDTATSH